MKVLLALKISRLRVQTFPVLQSRIGTGYFIVSDVTPRNCMQRSLARGDFMPLSRTTGLASKGTRKTRCSKLLSTFFSFLSLRQPSRVCGRTSEGLSFVEPRHPYVKVRPAQVIHPDGNAGMWTRGEEACQRSKSAQDISKPTWIKSSEDWR